MYKGIDNLMRIINNVSILHLKMNIWKWRVYLMRMITHSLNIIRLNKTSYKILNREQCIINCKLISHKRTTNRQIWIL